MQASSALELRGPFETPGRPALYYLRNTTAGILGGDSYDVELTARGRARVQVAASASTKAFAMPGAVATTRTRIVAEDEAYLIAGPQPTILQFGSRLMQETDVDLSKTSCVLLAEVLAFGRLAQGELLAFASYESRLRVRAEGAIAYEEAYRLTPNEHLRRSLANRGVVASIYALGAIEQRALDWLDKIELTGVSALPNDVGFVVRQLSPSLSDASAFVARVILSFYPQ